MKKKILEKKSVMNQIISVFVLILVISVLSGMTFLFVSSLKTTAIDTSTRTSSTTLNLTGVWINTTGYTLPNSTLLDIKSYEVVAIWNATSDGGGAYNLSIPVGNATISSAGVLTNASAFTWDSVSLTYSFTYIAGDQAKAYLAVNKTEDAGFQVTNYLALLFLALIFGAVLIVVLRIILPYINVGRSMGGSGF